MSELRKTDPLDDWLFRIFKAGMFLLAVVGIYHLVDKELHINEFLEGTINLQLAKFCVLALGFGFALYLLSRKRQS
jgi:hypothetical protein